MDHVLRRLVTTTAASGALAHRRHRVMMMRSLSSSSSKSAVINQPHQQQQRPRRRPIYITATRPDVGKTSVCLALVSHCAKYLPGGIVNVGYMKATSDRLVSVASGASIIVTSDDEEKHDGSRNNNNNINNNSYYKGGTAVQLAKVGGGVVDGDVELLRSYFSMNHLAREDMSPTSIPRGGYARKSFMLQSSESESEEKMDDKNSESTTKLTTSQLLDDIKRAYENIVRCTNGNSSNNTMTDKGGGVEEECIDEGITIIEGTGHAGAGTIVGAGNAYIASELNAHVVLVADGSSNNGGIEGAFDELHMNRSLFMVSVTYIHTHKYTDRESISCCNCQRYKENMKYYTLLSMIFAFPIFVICCFFAYISAIWG